MYPSIILLLFVTALYAGYNVFVKVSTNYVPSQTTTTIVATISLQAAALLVSCVFAAGLLARGGAVFSISAPALAWAVVAGMCIGAAEIGYFYLFRGVFGQPGIAANLAIPIVVSGTILLAVLASWLFLNETLGWTKIAGGMLIVGGVILMFFGHFSHLASAMR